MFGREAILATVGRFSAGDARFVLYKLIVDEYVTMTLVEEIRRGRKDEVHSVKTLLGQFDDGAPESGLPRARKKETKPRVLSEDVLERRRAHGRFINRLRLIPKEDRERVLRLYRAGSRDAALEEIKTIQREIQKRNDAKTGVVDE